MMGLENRDLEGCKLTQKPQIYCFEFSGTKNQFLGKLKQFSEYTNERLLYINDYMVELSGESINFGVARGGHSGGYWYKPTITENDDKLLFSGQIEYIAAYSDDKKKHKMSTIIENVIIIVVFLPLTLFFKICVFFADLIKKITKRPIIKEYTPEYKLKNLMENILGCSQVQ